MSPKSGEPRDLAVSALRGDLAIAELSLAEWDLLIRQARRADVMARIACQLAGTGMLARVPDAPRAHLESARLFCTAQHEDVRRELRHIAQALQPLNVQAVLLKGAAYVHANSPAALGRQFTDIDILVPKVRLDDVESQLMLSGWLTTHLTPYDQRYYREWMHELPPMQHLRRQTTLDVHHNILPATARLKPSPAKLFAASQAVGPDFHCLSPIDSVLHSLTHLLHNEELSHGLRDLSDIDLLLRYHAERMADFWPSLVARARELDLARPLHYGLRSAHRLLGTPVPQDALAAAAKAAPAAPLGALMDGLWRRALQSQHASAAAPLTPAALFLLYVRAHWLRMPPLLLIRHLTIKALRRAEPDKSTPV